MVDMDVSGQEILDWLSTKGTVIVLIILGAWLVNRFGMLVVERLIREAIKPDKFARPEDEKQREDTLIAIIRAGFGIMIGLITSLLILDKLGLNIGPLLASAGIVGVALGFGGQWLIKDLIAGLFIIIENQYRVGDAVTLYTNAEPITGTVENISLRLTELRDLDGQLHHVPNGTIIVATNLSMEFAGVNLDIGVSYDTDIEKLIDVINNVGKDIAEDSEWKDKVLEHPKFLRIDEFAESSIVVKITGKTAPLAQWAVAGELRKRLKIAFDKSGIELPFPQVVVRNKKPEMAEKPHPRSATHRGAVSHPKQKRVE